jgi:outer membrane protein
VSQRLSALPYAVAAFLVVSTASAQGTKIAVVDLQGALLQTQDGMSAAATLKNYTVRRQTDLDRLQSDLQKEQVDLQKQERLLSVKSIQKRYEHWQRRMVKTQTKFVEYNKQLQKKQAGMMQPIMQKLFGVIRRAASKKGYDIVVDRAAVPYARADLDITDLVVQMYNSGGGAPAKDDAKKKE